jgi:hypothetical protein
MRAADGIGGDRTRATCYFKAMLGKYGAARSEPTATSDLDHLIWFNRSG